MTKNKRLALSLALALVMCFTMVFASGVDQPTAPHIQTSGTLGTNNSFDTARQLTVGTTTYDSLITSSEEDYFYVITPTDNTNGTMQFSLQNIPSGCDYSMIVYNANQEYIVSPVRPGNTYETVLINVQPNERYYVQVISLNGSSNSSYSIVARKGGKLEPNNSLSTVTTTYSSNFYFCDTLTASDTIDWYRISIPSGTHTIYLDSIPVGSDYDIQLYDFAGNNLLDESLNSGNADDQITVTNTSSTGYAIRVIMGSGGNSLERYRLYIE